MQETHIRNGIESMGAGEKALNKKSFFGGKKPDLDTASAAFDAAGIFTAMRCTNFFLVANSFKLGKSYDQAVEALLKSSDCHSQLGSVYTAAGKMEAAALICMQHLKNLKDGAEYYRKASYLYQTHGSADRAAECLEKAAKGYESVDVDQAIEFYFQSTQIYENEDKLRTGVDVFKRGISLMVRNKRYEKALEMSSKLGDVLMAIDNKNGFFKNCLQICLILIAYGDEVELSKKFNQFSNVPGFLESEEARIYQTILDSFENHDEELFNSCMKNRMITFLDNEVF
ncbi:hypothetical protein HK099_004814 [Clydaea vesicula]|uniref:Gamma-soluble NSF attachment protein n=1 Tax=Clydaea vesicula TaxID=447962 RepID=A0AAD5U383_9FUNG|nr:hypothetical protein HK099_004814 [Clydaea vesicula]